MPNLVFSPHKLSALCKIFGFLLFAATGCLADTINPIPRPADGRIVEGCNEPSTVSISLTDNSGAEIGSGTITVDCNLTSVVKGHFTTPVIKIPETVNTASGPMGVADFRQSTMRLQHSGEVADLSVEAVYLNPATGLYVIGNVFGTLESRIGNATVSIPDLFADTNHDGSLDSGDILYSVVDLNKYLNDVPTFTLGESFNIVDGAVAGLPGMLFSTTPLTFNQDTGNFTGTLFTGIGFADAAHLPNAVPEPNSIKLAAIAFLLGATSWCARLRLGFRLPGFGEHKFLKTALNS
jgi:hypothetical protein